MVETNQPIQLLNQGNGSSQLVSEHYGGLYRWFLWLTNTNGIAADLTQETFVAVWQSLDGCDGSRPFRPCLYGIARNVWRNHCAARPIASYPIEPRLEWPAAIK